MKKRLFRALTVCTVILMVLVCFGCPREPEIASSFTFKSMPYDATSLYAQIWTADKNNELLKILDFGKITKSQETFSGVLPSKTAWFFAVLSDRAGEYANPVYSVFVDCSSGIKNEYTINGYWSIEGASAYAPQYALSVDCLNLIQVEYDTPVQFDFDKAPFYFFSFNNAQGKRFIVDFTAKNARIEYSVSLEDMLEQDNMEEFVINPGKSLTETTELCEGEILYFLVRPYLYDNETEVTMTIHTPLQMEDDYISEETIHEAVYISDTEILFTTGKMTSYALNYTNKLYVYDTSDKTVKKIREFDEPVWYLTPVDAGVLFSTGRDIWFFDSSTRQITKKLAMSSTVNGMCLTDDELFVLSGNSSWVNPSTYRLSDFSLINSTKDTVYPAGSLVYMQESDAIFYISKNIIPVDIYKIWWDETAKKFQETHSPYHGDHAIPCPLKRFGPENYLITGAGNVYSLEEGDNFLKIDVTKNVGNEFTDIEFSDDYFYTLTNDEEKCAVRKFSMTDRLNAVKEYTLAGQKGADLVVGTDGIQILSVSLERMFWDTENDYFQVATTQLDFDLNLKN